MLNPPQASNGDPNRVEGEHFILHRKGIEFQAKVDGVGKFSGKGKLILTTCRLVLINENKNKGGCNAFDLPYANTYKEKFQQPIFGSNYWEGKCKPLYNSLPNDAEFKIWFTEGGCQAFLNMVRYNMKVIRENKKTQQQLAQEFSSQKFQQ